MDTFSPGDNFKTYRFAMIPLEEHRKELAARIQDSVRAFYGECHQLPAAMIISPRLVPEATAALVTLKLHMPIVGRGDCLSNEIWLEKPSVALEGDL
jgi:hypothetical protein